MFLCLVTRQEHRDALRHTSANQLSTHRQRNHQGLDNRLIAGSPVTDRTGGVRCRGRLAALLNFYERAA